jgi:mannan endo-1,4-beta-mannosidase
MKKISLILSLLLILTACSDINYPPRGIAPDETGDENVAPNLENNHSELDKYNLMKFDLTVRPFEWELNPDPPILLPSLDNETSFTVEVDFNSPQHYRIGIEAVPISENAVVQLSTQWDTFGAFYVEPELHEFTEDNADSEDSQDNESNKDNEYFMTPIYFPAQSTELTFTVIRGSVRIDRIVIYDSLPISPERFNTSISLNAPAPSLEAIYVYEYLNINFGQRVLAAQHCTVNTNAEIEAVYASTGRMPAVRFGDANGLFKPNVSIIDGMSTKEAELSLDWWNKGGIVGYTWMWESPDEKRGVFSGETGFSLRNAVKNAEKSGVAQMDLDYIETMVDEGEVSASIIPLIRDIDEISSSLSELALENVPVLWNPIPDAGSRLYWWGTSEESSAEDYIQLWRLMYDRMTSFHGLDNLIWIWSGGNHRYYPGNNRVDIIGESVFVDSGVGSQAVKLGYTEHYSRGAQLVQSRKPAIVTRSSLLPLPDVLARDNAAWLIWSLYRGDFVIDEEGVLLPSIEEMLDRFYNHELTICLDTLPDFKTTN